MSEQDNLQTIHMVYEAFEGYEDSAAVVAAFTAEPN